MKLKYSMGTTTWVIIISALVWIAYDVYAFVNDDKFSTISEVITEWSYYSPVVPFALGYIAGHWTWNTKVIIDGDKDKG